MNIKKKKKIHYTYIYHVQIAENKRQSFERSWGTRVKGTLPTEEQGKELHQTSETRQEKREWDKCFKC